MVGVLNRYFVLTPSCIRLPQKPQYSVSAVACGAAKEHWVDLYASEYFFCGLETGLYDRIRLYG